MRTVPPLLMLLLLTPAIIHALPAADTPAGLDPAVLDAAALGGPLDVIVRFDHAPGAADLERLVGAGFAPLARYDVVPAVWATGPARAAPGLVELPGVAFVEADRELPYLLDTAVDTINARPVWDATLTHWSPAGATGSVVGVDGEGVGIAVVDSGVDATHPDLLLKDVADLTGQPWATLANYKMVGRDSVNTFQNTPVEDVLAANTLAVPAPHTDNTGGHGTHVAGAAVGRGVASDGLYTGAAPGAHLVGYGAGEALTVALGLAAFDHIHANHEALGIRVVSNSWGGPGDWQPEFAVTKAVQRMTAEDGLVFVFAAGNSGGDGSGIQSSVWANIPEVISVANWDEAANYAHYTSSRGAKALERTWPDVAAVGTTLISTAATAGPVAYYGNTQDMLLLGGETVVPAPTPTTVQAGGATIGPYASFTGTSMATPIVSGVIALVLQASPDLSPDEVRDVLRATARLPGGATYADDGHALGMGLVDAAAAVAVASRMDDGLSLADALGAATAGGDPFEINADAPPAAPLAVVISGPSEANVGVPVTFTAAATGGDVYADETYAWDLDGDAIADASGATVTHTFTAEGPTSVSVTADDGTSTATATHAVDVVAALVRVFEDDMERGAGNWLVDNGGTTGAVNGWDLRSSEQGVYFGGFFAAASGQSFWHAGVRHTPATGGWAYVPGSDARLTTAEPLDLTGATEATLRFKVAGQSMAPLVVEARAGAGDWAEVGRVQGNVLWGGGALFYEERAVDLTTLAGADDVELRFRYTTPLPPTDPVGLLFWSVFDSQTFGGWGVDDVAVDVLY